MIIQDSPKQIALTSEQMNGIKDKYKNMVSSMESAVKSEDAINSEVVNTSEVSTLGQDVSPVSSTVVEEKAPVVNEPQVQEPNMFDVSTPGLQSNAAEQVNTQVQAPVSNPEPIGQEGNMFDVNPTDVSTNMFSQTSSEPTNAEMIESGNMFDTNVNSVEPVSNTFDNVASFAPVVNGEVKTAESNGNNVNVKEIQEAYEKMKVAINNELNNFSRLLESYGIDNSQSLNQNMFDTNQSIHM